MTRRIAALRAEVETLEESLVRGSTPGAEANAADPGWAIRQVRRGLLQQDLNARMAELALLTERTGSLEAKNHARRGAGNVPIVDASIDAAVQAPLPSVSSAAVELTSDTDTQIFGAAGASEEDEETLELEPVGLPVATNGSGATPASTSSPPEPARSAGETGVLEAAAAEERATDKPPDGAEVEPEPNIAIPPAEAVGPLDGPSEGQLDIAVAGAESVETPPAPPDPAESAHGARQPWRRPVALLMRGGLLTLVVCGALLALARSVPVAPDSQTPEPVAPVAPPALVAPPVNTAEREPIGVGTTIRSLPVAAAEMEPSAEPELEPEPDGVAETEREPVFDPIAEPPPQPPAALANATIRAPGFAGVNLRRAPSTSAATIRVLANGTRVELMGRQVQGDGLGWQQVSVPGGETGWVVAGTVQP